MKAKSGFTIFEMLLIMALLAIGLTPLLILFTNGILASSNVSNTEIAIHLAQQKMEQIV